jgi:hypothetical protein
VPRPQEELLKRLVIAVRDLASDPRRDERHLDRVRFDDPPERFERVELSESEKVEILRRDSFTCRYCGIRTVFLPVLRALSAMFPDPFPLDDGWTVQGTHPAYNLLSSTYDHIVSPTRGGESDPQNVVTACWPATRVSPTTRSMKSASSCFRLATRIGMASRGFIRSSVSRYRTRTSDITAVGSRRSPAAAPARTSRSSRRTPKREVPLSMQSR